MFADLHLHSPYSISTSPKMNIESIIKTANVKGINLIASADCLHPLWREHLRENLQEYENSGFYYRQNFPQTKVVLSAEISFVFKRKGKVHRVHLLFLFASFDQVDRLTKKINDFAKLSSDGRPILKIDPYDFLKNWLDFEKTIVIPAHIWTPWYSMLGAKSGFNSLEELFLDLTSLIDAYETGLSADPVMCGFVSKLDQLVAISNSDAHSLETIGREFNEFYQLNSFYELKSALRMKMVQRTFECFPQHGKYYFDGHRKCGYRSSPEETMRNGSKCPICKSLLVKGVLHRVRELADRSESKAAPFNYHIPLKELIAFRNSLTPKKVKVDELYEKIIFQLGTEINALHFAEIEQVARFDQLLAEFVEKMRLGKIKWHEGYDGLYGKMVIE